MGQIKSSTNLSERATNGRRRSSLLAAQVDTAGAPSGASADESRNAGKSIVAVRQYDVQHCDKGRRPAAPRQRAAAPGVQTLDDGFQGTLTAPCHQPPSTASQQKPNRGCAASEPEDRAPCLKRRKLGSGAAPYGLRSDVTGCGDVMAVGLSGGVARYRAALGDVGPDRLKDCNSTRRNGDTADDAPNADDTLAGPAAGGNGACSEDAAAPGVARLVVLGNQGGSGQEAGGKCQRSCDLSDHKPRTEHAAVAAGMDQKPAAGAGAGPADSSAIGARCSTSSKTGDAAHADMRAPDDEKGAAGGVGRSAKQGAARPCVHEGEGTGGIPSGDAALACSSAEIARAGGAANWGSTDPGGRTGIGSAGPDGPRDTVDASSTGAKWAATRNPEERDTPVGDRVDGARGAAEPGGGASYGTTAPKLTWTEKDLSYLYHTAKHNMDQGIKPDYNAILKHLGWCDHADPRRVRNKVRNKYSAMRRLLEHGVKREERVQVRKQSPYPLILKVKEVLLSLPDHMGTTKEVCRAIEADSSYGPFLDRRPHLTESTHVAKWQKQVNRILTSRPHAGFVNTGQQRGGRFLYMYDPDYDLRVRPVERLDQERGPGPASHCTTGATGVPGAPGSSPATAARDPPAALQPEDLRVLFANASRADGPHEHIAVPPTNSQSPPADREVSRRGAKSSGATLHSEPLLAGRRILQKRSWPQLQRQSGRVDAASAGMAAAAAAVLAVLEKGQDVGEQDVQAAVMNSSSLLI